ncbi:MAG: CAP domain-containing protein [Sporichthyaceae bacterium]
MGTTKKRPWWAILSSRGEVEGLDEKALRLDAVVVAVVQLTNTKRAKKDLPLLKWNPKLASAAQAHAEDMNKRNYLAHDTKGGPSWDKRIHSHGYPRGRRIGENVADGFDSAADVLQGWMDSPLHRDNILDPKFDRIGVGLSGEYWVQDFGGR